MTERRRRYRRRRRLGTFCAEPHLTAPVPNDRNTGAVVWPSNRHAAWHRCPGGPQRRQGRELLRRATRTVYELTDTSAPTDRVLTRVPDAPLPGRVAGGGFTSSKRAVVDLCAVLHRHSLGRPLRARCRSVPGGWGLGPARRRGPTGRESGTAPSRHGEPFPLTSAEPYGLAVHRGSG